MRLICITLGEKFRKIIRIFRAKRGFRVILRVDLKGKKEVGKVIILDIKINQILTFILI